MIARCLRGSSWFGVLLLAGCTSPTGGLVPEGQQLLKDTNALRAANPVPVPLPRELAKQLAPPYVVEPGDILLIQPADFDSPVRIPGDQPVLPDGSIHLGKFGKLIVAGLTVDQIEGVVREMVVKVVKEAGPITVRVVSRQSKVFYVLGEVNSPGAYPLSGRETVLDALLVAGGVNTRADLKKITMSRPSDPEGCRVVLPIGYEDIVQLGDTSTNYQIANGDRIFVPSRSFFGDLCNHFCESKRVPFTGPHRPCNSADECGCISCGTWMPAQRLAEPSELLKPPARISLKPRTLSPPVSGRAVELSPPRPVSAKPGAPRNERLTSTSASDQINRR